MSSRLISVRLFEDFVFILMEHERLKGLPDRWHVPMFAEDIGWIVTTTNVVIFENTGSNALFGPVVRQSNVAFGEFGEGNRSSVDY